MIIKSLLKYDDDKKKLEIKGLFDIICKILMKNISKLKSK